MENFTPRSGMILVSIKKNIDIVIYMYSSNPLTGLDRPCGFQDVEASRF
jgi:hypothetical protein